ncbi:MAG: DUF434 domain-containing protein, partial [Rubripirellula sp.]|nr:DUF434 domain-containing protein [Rubripirellula sp.]
MPDRRQHRGPHPQDERLFADLYEQVLVVATNELSWLLSRGYAISSSLKLVGDRHALTARQRLAISRSACSEKSRQVRRQRRIDSVDLRQSELWIDGYNVLVSVEAAFGGGVILQGQDGCYRDMASMHGSYRRVEETVPAIEQIGKQLAHWQIVHCRWLLDRPVSNSGRLKMLLAKIAQQYGWDWQVELVVDPDPILARCEHIVASADSQILDRANRWFNLAREVIDLRIPKAWVLGLGNGQSQFLDSQILDSQILDSQILDS